MPVVSLLRRVFLAIVALGLTVGSAAAVDPPYFEIAALNPGLGDVPDSMDRRTPRGTVASFLRAAEREDWDTAAHALDLSELPQDEQADLGPLYARMLHTVLERRAILDWSQLQDRPDALTTAAGADSPVAGEPRRSLLLRELDLSPVPAVLRLNRVRAGEDADPVWVFPRETVRDVPALHDRYGPSAFEEALPGVVRVETMWGLMLWELIGVPVLILATWFAGAGTFRLFSTIERWMGQPAGQIAAAARLPAVIAALTIVLWWGTTEVFVFSAVLDTVISPLVAVGFTAAALLLVMNGLGALLRQVVGPGDVDLTARESAEDRAAANRLTALRHIMTVVVFLVGGGIVLATADVFRTLGFSLLASAGALTLVIGFAAREVLGNIIASLQIAMNQSARVGDRIVWKDHLAWVEKINFTFVQLQDWDGTRVIVPVGEFISETFVNWTLQEPDMLKILTFKIRPDADIDALRAAFYEILAELRQTDLANEVGPDEEANVAVADQDALGLTVYFCTPCRDPNTSWDVACAVRERLVKRGNRIAKETGREVFPDHAAIDMAA